MQSVNREQFFQIIIPLLSATNPVTININIYASLYLNKLVRSILNSYLIYKFGGLSLVLWLLIGIHCLATNFEGSSVDSFCKFSTF